MTNAANLALQPVRLAGRELPQLGLGCARIGSFNNPSSLTDSKALCSAALALGVTLFDSADVYGQGDSERVLGALLRASGPRAAPIVVTKIGLTFSWKMRLARPLKPALRGVARHLSGTRAAVSARRAGTMACNYSSDYLQRACAASRARLGVSRIDALLLHSPPAKVLTDGTAIETMRRLRDRGEIAAFGASLDEAGALNAALLIDDLEVIEITPHLLFGLDVAQRTSIAQRGVVVLLREVLRQAPSGQSLHTTLSGALADPIVSTIVVGTTNRCHLDALVAAL